FPWNIDQIFWEILCVDHGRLLKNAVIWATDAPQPVTVEGQGVLDVTIWKQSSSMTVHMVNLTNPMMMKGPIREFIPLGTQTVKIRLPDGCKVRGAKLLKTEGELEYSITDGYLEAVVPSILDHEVLAIDL
ncbi:MAG: hypothetical protein GX316_00125, partial [Firmicutes bacterium]|nr:hypothetical protein [Bacillota bacterium]